MRYKLVANQYEKNSSANHKRGNIDPKESRVKYARTALNPDIIEKKFQSLKGEIAVLKRGSFNLENMNVDIESHFLDEILAKLIPDQFQST